MGRYEVQVHGRRMSLLVEGEAMRGFLTTRFVEAASEAEARDAALLLIGQHPAVVAALDGPEQSRPVILTGHVSRLPWWKRLPRVQPGLAFYGDAPDEVHVS